MLMTTKADHTFSQIRSGLLDDQQSVAFEVQRILCFTDQTQAALQGLSQLV